MPNGNGGIVTIWNRMGRTGKDIQEQMAVQNQYRSQMHMQNKCII